MIKLLIAPVVGITLATVAITGTSVAQTDIPAATTQEQVTQIPERAVSDGVATTPTESGGPQVGIANGFDSRGNLVFNLSLNCTGSETFVAGGPGFSNFAGYRGATQPQTLSGSFCHTPSGVVASNGIFIDANFHVCAGMTEVWIQISGTQFDDIYKIPVPQIANANCTYPGLTPYFIRGDAPAQVYQPGVGQVPNTAVSSDPPKQVTFPQGPLLPDSTPTPVPTP
jgi:hypothetical protein